MKTSTKTLAAGIAAILLDFNVQAQGNTALSGTASNGCSANAGTIGSSNAVIGCNAGNSSLTGAFNVVMGNLAGNSMGNANYNVLVGYEAGFSATTAEGNTLIGYEAGAQNLGGRYNSALGWGALNAAVSGYNSAFGGWSLSNAYGSSAINDAFGYNSLTTLTTGSGNAAFGYNSLANNLTGTNNCAHGYQTLLNNTASNNNAFGYNALNANTSGTPNDAFGYEALYSNTTGQYNAAFGYKALYSNTGSINCAFGYQALYSNTGTNNCGFGIDAGNNNTYGSDNVAVGNYALYHNNGGGANTVTGYEAFLNGSGSYNTATGMIAGNTNTSGSYNTFLGYGADVAPACSTLSNMTALGYEAVVTAANTAYVGNASMTGMYCAAGQFTTSDGRFKTNVTTIPSGLAFIKKLRPVTYNMNTQALDAYVTQGMSDSALAMHKKGLDFTASMAIVHSGFIAQEVEQAGKDVGFTNSIVHTSTNSNDPYAVNYSEIVVPLVKAVQELSAKVDSLLAVTQGAGNQNGTNSNATSIGAVNNIELTGNAAIIYQNAPNPFGDGTMVKYFIPANSTNAQIIFYDQFGSQLNTFNITATGAGQLNVASANLAPGTYSYSLIINGTVVDTKKMIKTN